MKIKIRIGELVEQISQAAITVDAKSVDQPNSKIYLRAMKTEKTSVLYYYSTTQVNKTFLKSDADVIEPGEVLVEASRLLGGLQGRDPNAIAQIEALKEKTTVKIGKNTFSIPNGGAVEKMTKEVDALPFKGASIGKIKASLLAEFIRRSAFCIPSASNGQQRFAMDVLHLKSKDGAYQAQATDGNIISTSYGPKIENLGILPSLLIPQESLVPLQKLVLKQKNSEVEFVDGPGNSDGVTREVFFRMSGTLFGCRLRTGKYPNVQLLIDNYKPTFELEIGKDDLKGALTRAGNFVVDGERIVHFNIDNDKSVKIKAGDDKDTNLRDEVDSDVRSGTFDIMQVSLALDYISNVVNTLNGEKSNISFSSAKPGDAVLIAGEDRSDEGDLIVGSVYAISPVKAASR